MKSYLHTRPAARRLLCLALTASLALPLPALAGTVALATAPLSTSTTSTVKPNLMFILDDSGSMAWENMPDDTSQQGISTFSYGYYGLRSNQCNMVYYDPTHYYQPPFDPATNLDYANASFTSAYTNGFNTGAGTVNLSTSFRASQSLHADSEGQAAYYYNYSGTQTTQLQKNYSTANTFRDECSSAQNDSPGQDVFTKISLSNSATTTTASIVASCSSCTSTSVSGITVNGTQQIMAATATGSTTSSTVAENIRLQINACTNTKTGNCTTTGGHGYTATRSGSTITLTGSGLDTATTLTVTRGNTGTMSFATTIFPKASTAYTGVSTTNLINFANWYSYYRTRILMMKTAAGRAFSSLNNSYRVGLINITDSSPPVVPVGTFEGAQRTNWFTTLYGLTPQSGTPLREALSNAGRYYAGRLSGTDPVQYSCQQNFAILSTDGYWNSASGFQLNGSTAVGNQDGTAAPPMWDGYQAYTTVTTTYTHNSYSRQSNRISGGQNCQGGRTRIISQPQRQTCAVATPPGTETCTAWTNNGSAVYVSPYTSSRDTCDFLTTLPSPNPSNRVATGSTTTTGSSGGTSDTLADVAMYYYQTDLRPGTCTLCTDNVFTSTTDNADWQHMTTFTLGLGASGRMNYSSSYQNDGSGDYFDVAQRSPADSTATPPICSWQANGTVCTWPIPGSDHVENIDDLWHAAVNGRGAYFSTTSPASLSAGLANALAGINARKGAGAAASTSTLNPVAGDNFAYVASYTSVSWKGNLEERGINLDTGRVNENAAWCVENIAAGTCNASTGGVVVLDTNVTPNANYCVTPNATTCAGGFMDGTSCKVPLATTCTGTMNAKVGATTDTRTIYTASSATPPILTAFDSSFTSAAAASIGYLSQWSSLTSGQQTLATNNLINFLRGQNGYENRSSNTDKLYRAREAVLGDALESQPAFMSKPVFSYTYPGYSDFKAAQSGRAGTVYMGANDGMLHAFDASNGDERWAYVPSMVIPNMWKLADINYATSHVNYVNGSPTTSDVCTATAAICNTTATSADWKTILVGGLNGGGRGYYALDITDPASPVLLWEFTTTAGIGKIKDDSLGYSFGQPVIARKSDGTWVVLVTSGYNNASPGDGTGYLYVLNAYTGAIISKISTGVGGSSGLAKIAAWNDDPAGTAGYVYGGDLEGNLWRFDINNAAVFPVIDTAHVMKFATLFSAAGEAQPITTTPVLGKIAGNRVVFIGTGKYLENADITDIKRQSLYAIKDADATATLVNPRTTLVQQTITAAGIDRTVSAAAVNWSTGRGWYIDFPDGGVAGATGAERVNIDGKLVLGALLAPTIVPAITVCEPAGHGWLNFFNYQNGGVINTDTTITSVRYDAPIVGVNVLNIQGQPKVEVVTSNNPTPSLQEKVNIIAQPGGFRKKRVLWRELIP